MEMKEIIHELLTIPKGFFFYLEEFHKSFTETTIKSCLWLGSDFNVEIEVRIIF